MTFAEAFRHHRMQSNLTQKDISDFLKLGQIQMVSNVERGMCYFNKTNLKKICTKYGWNYKHLANIVVEEKCKKIEKEWLGAK